MNTGFQSVCKKKNSDSKKSFDNFWVSFQYLNLQLNYNVEIMMADRHDD